MRTRIYAEQMELYLAWGKEPFSASARWEPCNWSSLSPVFVNSNICYLRALSFCQNWPARPVTLQIKCNNLKENWHDYPSHSSGGVYISSWKIVNLKAL